MLPDIIPKVNVVKHQFAPLQSEKKSFGYIKFLYVNSIYREYTCVEEYFKIVYINLDFIEDTV